VLVEPGFQEISAATLRLKNPYLAFSRALALFYQPPDYPASIHPTAVIDPTAEIGEGAHIGAYVVVGPGVRLGAHATLLPMSFFIREFRPASTSLPMPTLWCARIAYSATT